MRPPDNFLTENEHTDVHLIVGMQTKGRSSYKDNNVPFKEEQNDAVVLDDNRMCSLVAS